MKNYELMHLASQYLAAAAICYVEKKSDDSHTSLKWDTNLISFITHSFGAHKTAMSLSYDDYSLNILDLDQKINSKFLLAGKSHSIILEWIKEQLNNYNYDFHYVIPYPPITNAFIFSPDIELKKLSDQRTLAADCLQKFKSKFKNVSPIQTWPHHFDTAILINLSKTHSIGIGLAIPDNKANEFYFYSYGYFENRSIPVTNLEELSNGRWLIDKWDGAVLPINGVKEKDILTFCEESTRILSSYKE